MKNISISMRSIVTIILIVLTLLVAGLAYAIATSSPDKSTEASLPKTTADQDEEAASTSDTYTALQGDAFDEQYIAGMFAHHEGAVNMSEKALAFAGKQEIKDLANDIVQSQSREMTTLLDWQEKWGYERTYNGGHNGHTGGGAAMADDMIGMQDSLEGKEGKEFDVIFLKQMIIHHTQAIDMSKPAATNAKRDEIKTFAHNVITAQEKEIQLMKQWQQEWGY